MGRGLEVAGDQSEQVAVLDQLWQQLLHAGQHPIAIGLRHRLVQVEEAALEQARELLALGLAVQHCLEGLAPDVGVVMPVSVTLTISARMPYSSSNASRYEAAPAAPVMISVPSMSNRIAKPPGRRSGADAGVPA